MSLEDKIQKYISEHEKFEDLLNELRRIICNHPFEETLKWGIPTYVYQKRNLVGIGGFKNHVGLWFFQGALLKDEYKILHNAQEGKTKAMRQIHFRSIEEIDENILDHYLKETIDNQVAGRFVKSSKAVKEVKLPNELKEYLKSDSALNDSFQLLTPGRQKDYANYISEAKREKTKTDRLLKITPLIKEGKGLYDKYK
ncbi:YdeI/OmpD-associated family protein [Lutimonas zeaxanthinifaciens]|uniref:YdeI/OmpD-associated family protein n=1 Tax=Lutimonas zeaxanthinifaciens TaxID=3060215 RepID=UPI00265D2FD2|nr:DUF1801 domain-containing protein [Lutimonas sp. YSD2104]WKK67440.1 DUF1801 domain-containing protein [Lutimonas sp. YSD2104]